MKRENYQSIYDGIYITLFILLLFTNTFVRAEWQDIRYIGDISIGLTMFAMFFLLMKTYFKDIDYSNSYRRIYASFILFGVIITVSFMRTDYMEGYDFIQFLFHLIFIVGAVRMYWNKGHIKIFAYVVGFVTVLFFYDWMQSGFTLIGFKSIYGNENYLAVLLFAMFFFHILAIKYSRGMERAIFFLLLAMNALLIVMTSARSVLIGIVVIFIAWKILQVSKKVFAKLIYLVIIGNFLFVGVYVGLKGTGLGDLLNGFSVTVFNKNLFSGRPEIWQGVIQAIMEKPFFGHGLGVRARDVAETNLTAHNMYLQILLEFGIVGFIAFLIVLISIWTVLLKNVDHFVAKLSACFMLGILVYNYFELTLFQNNYSIALFQWLIMTIGISFMRGSSFKNTSRLQGQKLK